MDIPKRKLWGRRMTRPLGKDRAAAYESLRPMLAIDAGTQEMIDPAVLFGNPQPCWLEIGFGDGAHLAALIARHENINFIGAEPFLNGVGSFLRAIDKTHYPRVRVFEDDARMLLERLADQSLERIYILNPDPWPKKRHHKRRFVNRETLDQMARILKPGGILTMTSDVADLAAWMVTHAANHTDFEWMAENAEGWRTAPIEWPLETKFARKGREAGRKMIYLVFRRK